MTINVQHKEMAKPFTGLLAGTIPGQMLSWGLLEVVGLFPVRPNTGRAHFAPPLRNLKVVQVPTYGTLVLRNTAPNGVVIAPMHIGFFQDAAQNHATSRVLILDAGETLTIEDCFCIQQTQGGFLKEAQQRFMILPLGLRRQALEKRGVDDFGRLWEDIGAYTRKHGIRRAGHLERFLRPNFARLLPYRHAFEPQPGQVGAAYFIAGQLVGVELAPNAAYWQEIMPILNIYCYGPAALLAEQYRRKTARQPVDLEGLTDLADLAQRLAEMRRRERGARVEQLEQLVNLTWRTKVEEEHAGLRVLTLSKDRWLGQAVHEGQEVVYLSLFNDPA